MIMLVGGLGLSLAVLSPSISAEYPEQNNIASIATNNANTGKVLSEDNLQYNV